MNNPQKPLDSHVGWWAVRLGFVHEEWNAGYALMDLPFRFEGELDPKTNFINICSEVKPRSDLLDQFYSSFLIRTKRKFDQFALWTPEKYVKDNFFNYYLEILEAFSQIR